MRLPSRAAFPVLCLVLVPASIARAQQPPRALRPITIDDYFQIREVSDPDLSPEGRFVTYTVESRLLKEDKNEGRIWVVPTAGGKALPLTAAGASSSHARWSPSGKSIAFLSARDEGKTQVWLLPRLAGEAERLTDTPRDVEDFAWSPDSRHLFWFSATPVPRSSGRPKRGKTGPVSAQKGARCKNPGSSTACSSKWMRSAILTAAAPICTYST